MKKSTSHNRESAQMQLLASFARFFLNIINLRSFIGATTTALEKGKEHVKDEWRQGAQSALAGEPFTGVTPKFFHSFPDGFVTDLGDALASRSIRIAGQTVNSAGIVFAHTLLDELISECCLISFAAKPGDWFRFVENRKVDFQSLKQHKVKALQHSSAEAFIREICRESMLDRMDYLHNVCAPKIKPRELPTAWIDRDRLEKFDGLRHRIIHGKSFSRKIERFDEQVQFVIQAGFSFLFLVQTAYGPFEKEDMSSVSMFRVLRGLAIVRKEIPEMLDVIEKYADDFAKRNPGLMPKIPKLSS